MALATPIAACGGGSEPTPTLDAPGAQAGGDELAGGDDLAGEDQSAAEETDSRAEETESEDRAREDAGPSAEAEDRAAEPNGSGDAAPAPRSKPERERPLSEGAKRQIEAVQNTLREFFGLVNNRDGSVCTKLVTANYLRETTGLRGDAAVRKCRRDISSSEARVELVDINGVELNRRKALIQFTANVGNTTGKQIYRLVFSDRWRIDGDGTADAAR